MEVEFRVFATFREAVGRKSFVREFEDGATVGDAVRALSAEHPDLSLLDDDGSPREFVSILKNGQAVAHMNGLATDLEDGDTLSLFPPVAGGRGSRPPGGGR